MSGAVFSHIVRVDRIGSGGKHFRIEASESERKAVATALGIVSVAALTAELDVRPRAGSAIEVSGTLTASVVQTDVVTLEPVAQDVVEGIEVTLTPAEEVTRRNKPMETTGEAAAENRDVYRNGQIDLGALTVEHLALGLDPYPRAPGVEFPGHIEDAPEAGRSPFAALQRLKRDQD